MKSTAIYKSSLANMPIELIIFDLDGTLIDSSIDITNALNYAIEPYDLPCLTNNEAIKMVGEGITRLIEKLIGEKDISAGTAKDDVSKRFIEHYTEHVLDYTKTYPGVKETLERLSCYKKAVISNKRESLSIRVLEGLGLSGFFDVILGSDSVNEKKPSPIPIIKVLSDLNMRPPEAVIVGDSNFDVDAGKAAGVTTIAVTYGYRPRDTISHADYMIDRIIDLVPLIEGITNHGA